MQTDLTLTPFEHKDLEIAFIKFKDTFRGIIENTFGWEEGFQRERFKTKYELSWFYWLEKNQERFGYICYWQSLEELHLSLIIIDPERQNLGYGKLVMDYLYSKAEGKAGKITLSSFKKNLAAIRFYKKIGYSIVSEDQYFVDMVLNLS